MCLTRSKLQLTFYLAALLALSGATLRAQDDGGVSVENDGGGHEILESIFVPYVPNAPFSLTLATEWTRPMSNGGTYRR